MNESSTSTSHGRNASSGLCQRLDAAVDDSTTSGAIVQKKPLHYRFVKRAFDIVFSGVCIIIAFVPCLVLSVAIACDTKGVPIYTQTRLGKDGREFKICKFRTMVTDSDDLEKYLSHDQLVQWHAEHKVDCDPRITKLGHLLRKTSFDEVPNFLNVFVGQMSVIGPRAISPEELEFFGSDAALLLSVPSGITGWWQVHSRNNAMYETGERQALELEYARNASLGLDAKIFFMTFKAIFGGTGK